MDAAPLGCAVYPLEESAVLEVGMSSWECWYVSTSKIPNPIPASAKSRRMASFTAARRSLDKRSARAMTGRTLTRAESRRMVLISAPGSVGLVCNATGGSKMTGSCSSWEKLFVRVLCT